VRANELKAAGKMCAVCIRRRLGLLAPWQGSTQGTRCKAADKPFVHRGVVLTPGKLNAHFGIVQEMNDGETR
jgi:hypothetical protein